MLHEQPYTHLQADSCLCTRTHLAGAIFDTLHAAQSAGKSSLLEAFFNQRILPRGTGTVTKRPTIISLVTLREQKAPVVTFQDPRHRDVPNNKCIYDEG